MKNISVSSLQQQEHSCTQSFFMLTAGVRDKLLETNLTAAEWRIWCYLVSLDPFGDRGVAFSVSELMLRCRVKKSTYFAAKAKLQKLGLVYFQESAIKVFNLQGRFHSTKTKQGYSQQAETTDSNISEYSQQPQVNDSRIPADLKAKLEELSIPLDGRVRKAIASHDLSQAYGAVAHIERTWETIDNPRSVFLFQIKRQPVEPLKARGRVRQASEFGWTLDFVKRMYPDKWQEAAQHFGVEVQAS